MVKKMNDNLGLCFLPFFFSFLFFFFGFFDFSWWVVTLFGFLQN